MDYYYRTRRKDVYGANGGTLSPSVAVTQGRLCLGMCRKGEPKMGYGNDDPAKVLVGVQKVDFDAEVVARLSDKADNATMTNRKLSDFGMSTIAGSGSINFIKLCTALDTGSILLVDGLYPITVPGTTVVDGPPVYTLTKDIKLVGLDETCGFDFTMLNPTKQQAIFKVNGDIVIDIDLVRFTGISNIIFSNLLMTNFIKSINISGCYFSGQVVLFDFNIADNDFNPYHGIGELIFKYNIVKNISIVMFTVGGHIYKKFITLENIPFIKVEVFGNTINNFATTIIFAGTSNGFTDTEVLIQNRVLIDVHDNIVISDGSIVNDWPSAIYHCFILAECTVLKYNHNHVEGLRATQMGVYDMYANCAEVYYEYNYWKNNLALSMYPYADILYEGQIVNTNCLMKSKGNPSYADSITATTVFKHNTYIVEESFVTNLGIDKKWASVSLASITGEGMSYVIEYNTIDVPLLRFQISGCSSIKYLFNNNKIKADCVTGYMINQTIADSRIEICDNDIVCKYPLSSMIDYKMDSGDILQPFKLVHTSTIHVLVDDLKINHNRIEADFALDLIYYIHVNMFESIDNILVDIKGYTGLVGDVVYKYSSVSKSMLIRDTYYSSKTLTTNFTKIYPIQSDIQFKIKTPSFFNGEFTIVTSDYITGVATQNCLIDIVIKAKAELIEYNATYKLKLSNGLLSYKKSDGSTSNYVLAGLVGTVALYIDPDTGTMPARLKLVDTDTSRQITLSLLTAIPNAVVDVNITVNMI